MLIILRRSGMISFKASATLDNIDRICGMAGQFLTEECGETEQFHFQLGLREALSNAVIHGCKGKANRNVFCEILFAADNLSVFVRDPGHGFDWRAAVEIEVSPESERGRGLSIIRKCFEKVSFNDAGNEVSLGMTKPRREGIMSDVVKSREGATIRPGRDLVASSVEAIRAELSALLAEGVTAVTVDLDEVAMVDSLGMGLLVATHNSLRAKGGKLALVNVAPRIYEILEVMRLTRHFEVHKAGPE